jgi:hypothetical protein
MDRHVSYGLIAFDKTQREQVIIEQLPQVRYIARRIHARVPPKYCWKTWCMLEFSGFSKR